MITQAAQFDHGYFDFVKEKFLMFLVIDGPDGSGKTTLAKRLSARLEEMGVCTAYTFEPTYDSNAGRRLRSMLHTGDIPDVYSFADLFVEDRQAHLRDFILPSLEAGSVVICDRYKYSSLAYQQLQGVDAEHIIKTNRVCRVPDRVFILLPENVDVLLKRIVERGLEKDIFEKREFISRTLECYRMLLDYFPKEPITFLKAETSTDENVEIIIKECRFEWE